MSQPAVSQELFNTEEELNSEVDTANKNGESEIIENTEDQIIENLENEIEDPVEPEDEQMEGIDENDIEGEIKLRIYSKSSKLYNLLN
jgi:hypothetical protein